MDHPNVVVHDDAERVEPGELLEDCWFFGNLLQRRSRMLRSYSDPCTSSSSSGQEALSGKSFDETYESIKKLPEFRQPNLMKAPSEASSLERQDKKKLTRKGSISHRGKSSNRRSASSNGLTRTPSLPTSLETDELQDDETEFSMGKLIRQASMNYSDTLPPRKQHPTKALTPCSSMSRNRSRRKPEIESIKMEGLDEIKPQTPINNKLKTQKSLIDLESEELQGFKDLGFDFNKKELSPDVISIIPGLKEKKIIKEDEEKTESRRPYLSEAWAATPPPAPPVPRWGRRRSTDDMKAQIKFWARAVASNVRQEC